MTNPMSKSDCIADELADRVARICERTRSEVLELLQSQPAEKAVVLMPDWMSAVQLAQNWQLYNDKNEPTTAGILKWSKRPSDQFPLPHAYMGDILRFNRDEVDLWAREEGERRRTQNQKRRVKIA